MTAEDWLREHGIEIAHPQPPRQPGEYARYPTSALSGPLPGEPIEEQETQAVPSVVKIDLFIRGDITEWPTGKLELEDAGMTEEIIEIAPIDAAMTTEDEDTPDFALADEMTIPLPAITRDNMDITNTPTHRLNAPDLP
jgi:hypothetical protein